MSKEVKTTFWLFGLVVLAIGLHNFLISAFQFDEQFFFILTFIFALAFVISLLYDVWIYSLNKKPKDMWFLGWLGLLGLLGLLPGFSFGLFGFFGFFGFWGLKR